MANKINISKGPYAFNNFCAPNDVKLAFSRAGRGAEAGGLSEQKRTPRPCWASARGRDHHPVLAGSPRWSRPCSRGLTGDVPGKCRLRAPRSRCPGWGLSLQGLSWEGKGVPASAPARKNKGPRQSPRTGTQAVCAKAGGRPEARIPPVTKLVPCLPWGRGWAERPHLSAHQIPVPDHSLSQWGDDSEHFLTRDPGHRERVMAWRQMSKAPPGQGWAPTSVALPDARRWADTAPTATLAHAGPG